MPGFISDYANNRVLDCLFGGVRLDPPRKLYFGLSLVRAAKGGYVVEPRAPSYARAEVPNDLVSFKRACAGTKTNAIAIEFPLALEFWGDVESIFIADSPQGGNVLAMGDLPAPRTIEPAPQPTRIPVDALWLSHH